MRQQLLLCRMFGKVCSRSYRRETVTATFMTGLTPLGGMMLMAGQRRSDRVVEWIIELSVIRTELGVASHERGAPLYVCWMPCASGPIVSAMVLKNELKLLSDFPAAETVLRHNPWIDMLPRSRWVSLLLASDCQRGD